MIPLLNSSGRQLYALRRISDGTVLNPRAIWPAANDNDPIEGLDPDLQYLPILTQARPEVDFRLFTLNEAEGASGDQWHITYATVARPAEEAKINAANVEAEQNRRHYTEQERDKLIILGLGVLFRQLNNQVLTQREVNLKQRIIDLAARVWKNDQRLRDIATDLTAGKTPDLDSGWELTQ